MIKFRRHWRIWLAAPAAVAATALGLTVPAQAQAAGAGTGTVKPAGPVRHGTSEDHAVTAEPE